jgi:type IV pilus assembly protein PilP
MPAAPHRTIGIAAPLLALALLAGCAGEQQELRAWVDEQRQAAKPNVQPLQPPTQFQAQAYEGEQSVEPFSGQKLAVALKQEARQPNSMLAAEMNRRREPLESFPLDGMSMVGSLSRDGRPYALLRVNNLLYQVREGDYLGQNFGRITRIGETEIALREIVLDPAGEWVERSTTLQLQEPAR